jgi:hypothetical protein
MGYEFEFVARVTKYELGRYGLTVIYLPEELEGQLPFEETARVRVRGEIEEVPFSGAWQPGAGRKFLMVSKQMMQARKLNVGDWASVRFNLDDPEKVDVPEELEAALKRNKAAKKVWDGLTAGKKRNFVVLVGSAKGEETRLKRAAKAIEILLSGEPFGPPKRAKKKSP